MEKLNNYFKLQKEIFDYFGYTEDWKIIPLDDATDYFWKLNQTENGEGHVGFSLTLEELNSETDDYYEHDIYTQCFLRKYVYRTEDYTMICVDTHVDGNKLLQIFDNKKEIKE